MHPDRIGPYLIDRKIGSGGMGNVYRGVHEESGQEVAVKVLPASMAREDGFVRRFNREIEALKKLSSRYIVTLFDSGQADPETYYYAMEYVSGETLTNIITERKRIPWREVLDLSLQMAAALKAAHDAGIIHRDLKPSNLMIAKDGTVKLTDFGVAHVFATTRLTRTGGVVGTAEYMSPEQARGQRATQRSDLYSLGAVMYVMLTGRPPFSGQTANDILHKQQFAQFDKPSRYVPELPRLLEELVCTLLEKKPDRRLPSALVLMKKLEQVRSRIEFAERQQETVALNRQRSADVDSASGTGGDIDGASELTSGPGGSGESGEIRSIDDALAMQRPGPATLVRDLLREDAEAQLKKSVVARFFDNTFVLVTLFILVVASGFWLSHRTEPDPGELLARAERMLDSEPGSVWLRARNDILLPLLESDALPDRNADIRHYIRQVDQYDFSRSLKSTTPADGTADGEIERLIARAFQEQSAGNSVQAQQQVEALVLLTNDDASRTFLNAFLKQTLQEWKSGPGLTGRSALVQDVLREARQSAGNVAAMQRSRDTLKAVISLYTSQPELSEELNQCREVLGQIEAELNRP
ncbi:MAG: serine/threonine-protein kinase [Planctomycetaceae bacterium]